jgi:hypothetical protein
VRKSVPTQKESVLSVCGPTTLVQQVERAANQWLNQLRKTLIGEVWTVPDNDIKFVGKRLGPLVGKHGVVVISDEVCMIQIYESVFFLHHRST